MCEVYPGGIIRRTSQGAEGGGAPPPESDKTIFWVVAELFGRRQQSKMKKNYIYILNGKNIIYLVERDEVFLLATGRGESGKAMSNKTLLCPFFGRCRNIFGVKMAEPPRKN